MNTTKVMGCGLVLLMLAAASPAEAATLNAPSGTANGANGGAGFASVSCVINGLYPLGVGPLDVWSCAGAAGAGGSACFKRLFQADYCVSAAIAFAGGIGVGIAGPDGTVEYEATAEGTSGVAHSAGSCNGGVPFAIAVCGSGSLNMGEGDCFHAQATATATSLGGDSAAHGEGVSANCATALIASGLTDLVIDDPRTCSKGSTAEPSRVLLTELEPELQDGIMDTMRAGLHAKLDSLYVEPNEVDVYISNQDALAQTNPHIASLWDSWHVSLDELFDARDSNREGIVVTVWDC